jgi:acyl-coenzyme A synthetase/AMP-(fatty) acid ligase
MAAHVCQIAAELLRARSGGESSSIWVVLVLPEGLAQVVSVWGVLAAGLGYVPIDSETSAARLRVLLGETRPCAVIGEAGAALATVAAEFGAPMGTFPSSVADGLSIEGAAAAAIPQLDIADQGFVDVEASPPAPDEYALLLFSSGSTGVPNREQQIGGSGGSLEPLGPLLAPPGPLLTHLHTVYMAYSECLPTRLNPLAERTCFSQVPKGIAYNHRWLMGGSWFV